MVNRGRIAYTNVQKAEAVALAGLIGHEAAAEQLGIDPRTVAGWSKAAGVQSADYLERDVWQRIHDSATARVAALLGSGKLSPTQTATIAGIARRNLTAPDRPTAGPTAEAAEEEFHHWLEDRLATSETLDTDADMDAVMAAWAALTAELLRQANAEAGERHRPPLLSWYNGRSAEVNLAEIGAEDLAQWCQTRAEALLTEHGTLVAWHAASERQRAEAEAANSALVAQYREATIARLRPELPLDVAGLLAEAEDYLARMPA